ncbi:HET-domain-containing protein, partial [Glonium stellatum]
RAPSTKLPKRVVKVNGPVPRLYLTKEGETGHYITLSHCWGKTQPFTTKKDTLRDRAQGFTLDELPKTFRDAITVTRELGVDYVWIDSLCIVQDDLQDWQTESAKMASIYRNALLTIAATASPDGEKGCFFERPPDGSVRVDFSKTTPEENEASCALSDQLDRLAISARKDSLYDGSATFYACPGVTYLIDPLRKSPLNRRGWVVQERMLSRRMIHFADDQLFWECQTQFLSEGGTYNRVMAEGMYDRLTQNLRALEYYGPEPHRRHPAFMWNASVIGRWLNLVMEFSRKQLTQEMDIFPALAGVASVIQQRKGDRFLAGLWKNTLHLELLWIAFDAPHYPPAQWRAPSWSWAALNGEVEYYDHQTWNGFELNAEFVSTEAEWTGEPFSSRLRPNARLVVVGLLEHATCDPEPDSGRLQDITCYHLIPAGSNPTMQYGFNWVVFDQKPPPPSQKFWCLCICTERISENYVLLLEPTGVQPNEYRRIGAGRLDLDPKLFGGGERVKITLI